jgi:SIR2-like protein
MREKIVYFLGAGFSAPLNLPVMSTFLIRSKDLYFSDPEKYQTFESVFKMIDLMGKAKNYYSVDLFNIEEILSLLEMEDYVGSSAHKQAYLSYLRDVVLDLTPTFLPAEGNPSNSHLFSPDQLIDSYAVFVATLFGIDWIWSDDDIVKSYRIERRQDTPAYGVISLNYDLVLEESFDLIERRARATGRKYLQFARSLEEAVEEGGLLPFAKLHGSVDPLTIVPPTWNKVASEDVRESWRLAYRLLADATQIRFLGYSLPASDTYVRYLLESAVLESRHLKRIDVICLDDSQGTIEKRFRSLITFYRFRFCSGDIEEYLGRNRGNVKGGIARQQDRSTKMSFDKLERLHEHFMEQRA